MLTPATKVSFPEKIILALAEFDYLTIRQLLRLLGYSRSSLTYGQEHIKPLVTSKYVHPLVGRAANMPRVYTLTSKGREYAALLGKPTAKRFRPSEETDKAANLYFIRHTLLISDILIAARLLTKTEPRIVLTRQLRRKIFVALPNPATGSRHIVIEPDASVRFLTNETWEDFFHIEVYRNLPPAEWHFKQKVKGYIAAVATGLHRELFHAAAPNIAVFAQTPEMAVMLKEWTEEALPEQQDEANRFFFTSIAVETASPEDLFLSSAWEQACGTGKTSLLMLEEQSA
jgi:DNA-binding MarR family transcriptional regulator